VRRRGEGGGMVWCAVMDDEEEREGCGWRVGRGVCGMACGEREEGGRYCGGGFALGVFLVGIGWVGGWVVGWLVG